MSVNPGHQSGRIYEIWSRWLVIHREKSLEEFQASINQHIPIIHPVEREGFMGRQVWDVNDQRVPQRVPALPGDFRDI